MRELNRRRAPDSQELDSLVSQKRKCHVLVEFPNPELESVVVQWEHYPPSVFVQLKRNSKEPLQFYGKRSDIPGYAEMPKADPPELSGKLTNFIHPETGQPFSDYAFLADIVFSARAFTLIQPEPDLVLPVESLAECRAEALSALHLEDAPLKLKS